VVRDKSESFANRQKLQSAEFLVKLLVNIIKTFRLAEPGANLRKTGESINPFLKQIIESWGILEDKVS
jgi:hypothetical protein